MYRLNVLRILQLICRWIIKSAVYDFVMSSRLALYLHVTISEKKNLKSRNVYLTTSSLGLTSGISKL
jgi:hypothetical protein